MHRRDSVVCYSFRALEHLRSLFQQVHSMENGCKIVVKAGSGWDWFLLGTHR